MTRPQTMTPDAYSGDGVAYRIHPDPQGRAGWERDDDGRLIHYAVFDTLQDQVYHAARVALHHSTDPALVRSAKAIKAPRRTSVSYRKFLEHNSLWHACRALDAVLPDLLAHRYITDDYRSTLQRFWDDLRRVARDTLV